MCPLTHKGHPRPLTWMVQSAGESTGRTQSCREVRRVTSHLEDRNMIGQEGREHQGEPTQQTRPGSLVSIPGWCLRPLPKAEMSLFSALGLSFFTKGMRREFQEPKRQKLGSNSIDSLTPYPRRYQATFRYQPTFFSAFHKGVLF